jgi:RNA exonuclease 1
MHTTTTLATIQSALLRILDFDTILVGHSLECDLQALKLAHPHVIDTSVIYQHSRGPPYKPSLKWLAQKWLKRKIQDNHLKGHDSAEDAKTCIDLLKLKLRRGMEFGLFNVDQESLFARLKRRGTESAVVEYGNRGNAFYGDKVRTCISAESDEEVVDGILEAVQTGHGFIWSRMKDLENSAKWKDVDSGEVTEEEMQPALARFDVNIQRLWEELPPCTSLMVITGSGDPREMSRLFAKKKTYDAELKVKKYDDCQVKWLDEDQQNYNLAVDKARTGLGFVTIK